MSNEEQKEVSVEEQKAQEVQEAVEKVQNALPYENIVPGMTVRVHERIIDVNSKGEEKQRVQIFEGLVIGVKGSQKSRTVTVRKNAKGWMVEKIFPLSSPNIENIEVVKQFKVRRAKLTYLRNRFKRKMREV